MSRSCLAMTPLLVQNLVALVLRLGVGQLCFVVLQIGFRLGQRHLVRTRIDHDKQFALPTSWPSWKLTCMICPSTRVFSETVLNACTEPSPVKINGKSRFFHSGDTHGNDGWRTAGPSAPLALLAPFLLQAARHCADSDGHANAIIPRRFNFPPRGSRVPALRDDYLEAHDGTGSKPGPINIIALSVPRLQLIASILLDRNNEA